MKIIYNIYNSTSKSTNTGGEEGARERCLNKKTQQNKTPTN